MSQQLIFNFPFKKTYLSQDFYITKNNFNAFKLIESWPKWPSRFINIFGPKGCGKTHLTNIISSKINSVIISSKKIDENIINKFKTKECLIIDDFDNDVEENLLYSIINLAVQDNKYLIISSPISLKKFKIKLKDLNSRFTSFIEVGIDLPTDDLIKVILTKNFSDKQISVSKKNIDYVVNNIDRSFEKINLFSNSIDNLSLEKGKPINLKFIKDVLKKIK